MKRCHLHHLPCFPGPCGTMLTLNGNRVTTNGISPSEESVVTDPAEPGGISWQLDCVDRSIRKDPGGLPDCTGRVLVEGFRRVQYVSTAIRWTGLTEDSSPQPKRRSRGSPTTPVLCRAGVSGIPIRNPDRCPYRPSRRGTRASSERSTKPNRVYLVAHGAGSEDPQPGTAVGRGVVVVPLLSPGLGTLTQ